MIDDFSLCVYCVRITYYRVALQLPECYSCAGVNTELPSSRLIAITRVAIRQLTGVRKVTARSY
jgi:hypothetical protein